MPRGVRYDDETRSTALAALMAGESVRSVAERMSINRTTVTIWRDNAGLGTVPVKPENRVEIGDLVADLLASILRTLRAQTDSLNDPEWIKKYSPSDAAVLFGVLADKGVRLLEAQVVEDGDGDGP